MNRAKLNTVQNQSVEKNGTGIVSQNGHGTKQDSAMSAMWAACSYLSGPGNCAVLVLAK